MNKKSKIVSSIYNKYCKGGKMKYDTGGNLNPPEDDKTKTYTNKAEYDKALQAYNDSLNLYNNYIDKLNNERIRVKKISKNTLHLVVLLI